MIRPMDWFWHNTCKHNLCVVCFIRIHFYISVTRELELHIFQQVCTGVKHCISFPNERICPGGWNFIAAVWHSDEGRASGGHFFGTSMRENNPASEDVRWTSTALFGLTYLCETAFSLMKITESKSRSARTDDHLDACLKLAWLHWPADSFQCRSSELHCFCECTVLSRSFKQI